MDKFYIITNKTKDPGQKMTQYVSQYLIKAGKTCLLQDRPNTAGTSNYKYTDATLIPVDVECVLVIGGDGTLLQAARDLVDRSIPLLGINQGTMGYLAEIEERNVKEALDKLILGHYSLENRMMIMGTAYHQGEEVMQDLALNDIVIGRSGRMRVVDFHIYVNDAFLMAYSADGIIISTPTGSTGYSLSAGGPIVSPQASLMLLTPIAPHTLNTRSIILPDDIKITVEIRERNPSVPEEAVVTFDGDTAMKLSNQDQIVIRKAKQQARLIKINHISFLEVLRKKMNG